MPSFPTMFAARISVRGHRALHVAMGWVLFSLFSTLIASAQLSRTESATRAYRHAEVLRRHLLAQSEDRRTSAEYESVLNAYRTVYHGDPAATEAPDSIVAVAELLQIEGRQFDSAKDFQSAIGQYQYLRQQYPSSSLRYRALLTAAAIQRDDLHNPRAAAQLDREFLHLYPHNPLAAQAQADLRPSTSTPNRFASFSSNLQKKSTIAPSIPVQKVLAAGFDKVTQNRPKKNKTPATLQSIRYWSAAGNTRIALDLTQPVTYQVSRTSQPDGIVFHLAATQPSTLVLRQPIITRNDPFLGSINVHVESNGDAQIVLNVKEPCDYAVFLLPSPDRLIIDLHSGVQRDHAKELAAVVTVPHVSAQEKPVFNTVHAYDAEEHSALPPPATSPMRPTSVVKHILVMDGADSKNVSVTTASGAAIPDVIPASLTRTKSQSSSVNTSSYALDNNMPEQDSTLARVLGLKVRRIVIDAGHGGHDSGTLGPRGLEEKDVVLDVALRLGRLLQQRLGADVVYTRTKDTFIPLERRTAIANAAHADLFLSIHANSSHDVDARGVETYFLNLTSTPGALAVAARENATSNRSVYELSDIVRRIALSNKMDESRTFAMDVQQSLYDGLESGNPGLRNRGVKQAPFVVLIGANMPSILAEISFLTNRQDASELRQPAYRQRIAESIYRGVAGYVEGMGGVRVAENQNKSGR